MSGLIFHLIPHTHWDREWYLPRAAFQARLVPALDDLLDRLQADPGYRSFLLDGQTVLVADYLSARPEREAELKALVKTGRLQLGPWYVLTDELIPSGEALVRNLQLGAADADVSRLRDLLAELEPQSAFRVSRLEEFFQAVADGAKPAPLAGELRWSYRYTWTLQGVHATRAPLKRRSSAAELFLERLAEPLAALARRAGGRDRRPLLELAWRTLVRCQFHDSIAGCASDDVARAVEARLTSVKALARAVVRGSLLELVHHDPDAARSLAAPPSPTLVLWNPAARPRRGVMIADVTLFRRDVPVGPAGERVPRHGQGYRPFALVTSDGHTVPVQVLDRRVGTERLDAAHHYPDQDEVDEVRIAFRAPSVPGLGLASAGLTVGATAAGGARPAAEGALVKGRSLLNHWIEVALEPTGGLALHDRRSGQRFRSEERRVGKECRS